MYEKTGVNFKPKGSVNSLRPLSWGIASSSSNLKGNGQKHGRLNSRLFNKKRARGSSKVPTLKYDESYIRSPTKAKVERLHKIGLAEVFGMV